MLVNSLEITFLLDKSSETNNTWNVFRICGCLNFSFRLDSSRPISKNDSDRRELLSTIEEVGRKRQKEMVSHSWVVNPFSVFKCICYFLDKMLENIFQGTAQRAPPKVSEPKFWVKSLFGAIEVN